jgi:anti-anti-sigma factor
MIHDSDLFEAAPPTIELDTSADCGFFSAVLTLCGEHDLATGRDLELALRPLCGRVLIDLSECSFIDSTTISLLIRKARELAREGYTLELYVPRANAAVTRALHVVQMSTLVNVHATCPR